MRRELARSGNKNKLNSPNTQNSSRTMALEPAFQFKPDTPCLLPAGYFQRHLRS
jgi:hypothetical protein